MLWRKALEQRLDQALEQALEAAEPAEPVEPVKPPDNQTVAWPRVSLIPLGFGAWAPIYAGARVGRRSWIVWGVIWTLLVIAGWVGVNASSSTVSGIGTGLIMIGWIGAIATSYTVRRSYIQELNSPFREQIERARVSLADREQARKLAASNPQLAREMGVGRPDLARAASAGLVDVNNAPARVLRTLPGIDWWLARRIVKARNAAHGFSSLNELGMVADLDGDLVEGLRDYVVFLPRLSAA